MAEKPRILVLFGNVPLHGQERANIEVMDVLQKSGCDVLFLIREEWTKDTIQAELNRRGLRWVAVPWFDAIRRGHGPRVWWRNVRGIAAGSVALIKWKMWFSATHIHCGSLSNALNFLPALMFTRIPIIYRAGDVPSEHHVFWKKLFVFLRWRVSHFVAISEYIANQLEVRGVEKKRITQIYNIPPCRAKLSCSSLSISQTVNLTFVYFGQLNEEKGVGLLVEAAIRLLEEKREFRLLIAGDLDDNNQFAVNLKNKVFETGLNEEICFLGYVEAIPQLLAISDVHFCPSLCVEALGNVVLEAKMAGIPSVVFPSGGLPELIEHGEDGLICAEKTSDALACVMRGYLRNPETARLQGKNAKSSLSRFGREEFREAWLNVYRSAS